MVNYVSASTSGLTPINAQAIQYEPTLKLDNDEPWHFKTNNNDPTNPVFGFKYINPDIDSIGSGKRLILFQNKNYVSSTNEILGSPWVNDQLHLNGSIPNPDIIPSMKYNGKIFYLSETSEKSKQSLNVMHKRSTIINKSKR